MILSHVEVYRNTLLDQIYNVCGTASDLVQWSSGFLVLLGTISSLSFYQKLNLSGATILVIVN